MARLAFFSENLPQADDPISNFSFELMKSLADQQHEVRVFSSYDPKETPPPSHQGLSILRPFRNWGWLELPRILPLLIEFQPEVIHVVQPRKQALKGLTNAMNAVPAMVPMCGKPSIVTSFYDLKESEIHRHRLLLMACDAVTVSSVRQAQLLEAWFAKLKRTTPVSVLPLPGQGIALHALNSSPLDEEVRGALVGTRTPPLPEFLDAFLSMNEKVIFLPGDLSEHSELDEIFNLLVETLLIFPNSAVIFGGGWGSVRLPRRRDLMRLFNDRNLGARVLISGPLSSEAERVCYRRAAVVLAAALAAESLHVNRLLRDALSSSALLILSNLQTSSDTLPWRDREHAFIAEGGPKSWGPHLAEALTLGEAGARMRARLIDFAASQAVDQPANVMSRIYASLRHSK